MILDERVACDLRDVLAWLEHRYHAADDLWLHVMRAPSQPDYELSLAIVDTDRRDLDVGHLHADFLAALAALGYGLAWPQDGADPEDVEVPTRESLSDGQRVQAVDRIRQVLRAGPPQPHTRG